MFCCESQGYLIGCHLVFFFNGTWVQLTDPPSNTKPMATPEDQKCIASSKISASSKLLVHNKDNKALLKREMRIMMVCIALHCMTHCAIFFLKGQEE